LIDFIKQFWIESGTVYGYRKIYDGMQSAGEACGENRVCRLMQAEGLQSQRGYKRRNYYGGKPANVADNILERDFGAEKPNQTWVTDITYIRTYEGWFYLAVVLDLSDQGSQYTSGEWRSYLKANNLTASMSRRGNCHDNAVDERIQRRIYRSRAVNSVIVAAISNSELVIFDNANCSYDVRPALLTDIFGCVPNSSQSSR
jgi:putative transposase